jgi:uncharacterized membrane protein YhaH (DUF805 family)
MNAIAASALAFIKSGLANWHTTLPGAIALLIHFGPSLGLTATQLHDVEMVWIALALFSAQDASASTAAFARISDLERAFKAFAGSAKT